MLLHYHTRIIAFVVFQLMFGALALNIGIAQEVLIDITGNGSSALYIERGKTVQEPVEVLIGQTVRWTNNGNRDHTATAFTDSSEIIFDTGSIDRSGGTFDVTLNRGMFERAGGATGGSVDIEYVCDFHGAMSSKICLKDATEEDDDDEYDDAEPDRPIRRDITSLSLEELTAYRDAWRAIQASGEFTSAAGFHGCPLQFCHRDANTFLAWHREYLLKIERSLQAANPEVALHYWDWTSDDSLSTGIPAALTDRNYFSGGVEFRNPLRNFQFSCPTGSPPQTTNRNPQMPFFLSSIKNRAIDSYGETTFENFDAAIEGPHGSIHVWIRGHMSSVTFAAYDPIFWAHHSNVDRQWASWQEAGGVNPSPINSSLSLRGFPGRTVGDVVDFRSLNYEYDRYDSIITTQAFVMGQDGKSKTFSVDLPAATETLDEKTMELIVEGIPKHPKESYFIHVFVGKPDAILADVNPDSKNYVGSFGIFGHERPMTEGIHAMETMDRKVANVSGKVKTALENVDGGGQAQVTFIAENKDGQVVSFGNVPITGVQIGVSDGFEFGVEALAGQGDGGGRLFEGLSTNESFTEAYKDAAAKAQGAFGPDRKIVLNVVEIKGARGTIAGLTHLRVVVQARVE